MDDSVPQCGLIMEAESADEVSKDACISYTGSNLLRKIKQECMDDDEITPNEHPEQEEAVITHATSRDTNDPSQTPDVVRIGATLQIYLKKEPTDSSNSTREHVGDRQRQIASINQSSQFNPTGNLLWTLVMSINLVFHSSSLCRSNVMIIFYHMYNKRGNSFLSQMIYLS